MDTIYLDNAATSFPKPPAVARRMAEYLTDVGATINRSVYGAAQEAGVAVERLQLDGMPHGFGAQGGWIPSYDRWLEGIFADQ